jgi:hypothetical protein
MGHLVLDLQLVCESQLGPTQRIPLPSFITNVPFFDRSGVHRRAHFGVAAMQGIPRELTLREIARNESEASFLVYQVQRYVIVAGFYWPPSFEHSQCVDSYQRAYQYVAPLMQTHGVILMGDFNMRLGSLVRDTSENLRRHLLSLFDECLLLNRNPSQGRWSREEGGHRSVIDLVLITTLLMIIV